MPVNNDDVFYAIDDGERAMMRKRAEEGEADGFCLPKIRSGIHRGQRGRMHRSRWWFRQRSICSDIYQHVVTPRNNARNVLEGLQWYANVDREDRADGRGAHEQKLQCRVHLILH